jgi:hypothetical protein
MGHNTKTNKIDVQKERLKTLFRSLIDTNIAIMRFQLTLTSDKNDIKGLKKFIKDSEKALEIVTSITHYEILVSLYNTFISGKETYFATLVKTINNKNTIVKWDRTQKGFKLFQELENQAKAKSQEEYTKRLEQQEMIKKAKEQGKKVEMVYVDGKLQPRIVEEKSN